MIAVSQGVADELKQTLAILSSMDQCNTMSKLFAMEGVAYGTIRPSWVVSGSESHGLGAMERRAVTQGYLTESGQACWVDSPGRLRSWGDLSVLPAPISLGSEHDGAGGNIPRPGRSLFTPAHRGLSRKTALHRESQSGSTWRASGLSSHTG